MHLRLFVGQAYAYCWQRVESALEVLPGGAGSSGSRAGGTTRVVEVPKISCQGKVEVFAELMCDNLIKSFDARSETPSRFLERVRGRFWCEVAIALGKGFPLFFSGATVFSRRRRTGTGYHVACVSNLSKTKGKPARDYG